MYLRLLRWVHVSKTPQMSPCFSDSSDESVFLRLLRWVRVSQTSQVSLTPQESPCNNRLLSENSEHFSHIYLVNSYPYSMYSYNCIHTMYFSYTVLVYIYIYSINAAVRSLSLCFSLRLQYLYSSLQPELQQYCDVLLFNYLSSILAVNLLASTPSPTRLGMTADWLLFQVLRRRKSRCRWWGRSQAPAPPLTPWFPCRVSFLRRGRRGTTARSTAVTRRDTTPLFMILMAFR